MKAGVGSAPARQERQRPGPKSSVSETIDTEQAACERSGPFAQRTESSVLFNEVATFRKALDAERMSGRTVGLVPTMGFLHEGHASLMRRAAQECDVVAVTIFVNPLQFAPGEDLDSYPRDLEADLRVADSCGVTHVFAPSENEMYPEGRDGVLTTVHVGGPSEGLEGASRPTHFDGVATVVTKLFSIAGSCRAYFGEKDWQQLLVVRRLVHDLSLPVEVVGCPIVREEDGLAMSSRNVRLDPEARRAATVLYRALEAGRASTTAPESVMRSVIATEPLADLDYAACRDGRLLVAARFGGVRLIDNLPHAAPTRPTQES